MTAWHPSHTHQLCFSPPHCCNLEPLWSNLLVAITLLLMPGLLWTYLALAACRVYHPVKYRSPSLIVISLTWLEAENPSYFVSTLFISSSLFEVADCYWLSVVSGHHIVSLLLDSSSSVLFVYLLFFVADFFFQSKKGSETLVQSIFSAWRVRHLQQVWWVSIQKHKQLLLTLFHSVIVLGNIVELAGYLNFIIYRSLNTCL